MNTDHTFHQHCISISFDWVHRTSQELGDAELFVSMPRATTLSAYDHRLRTMMLTLRASVRAKALRG